MIREPVFLPGMEARIVSVLEPIPMLGYRDSWVLRYVCFTCRHRYLDFSFRYNREEAERLAAQGNRSDL